MAEISAKQVGELRERTGLGMMECKKALVESQGNLDKAEELLRIKSGNKASKVAGRTAAEGAVVANITGKRGALAEVNCETDFASKDAGFLVFAQNAVDAVVAHNPATVEALAGCPVAGSTLEEARKAIVAKLGENIGVRRFQCFEAEGQLASYLHGNRIGVLVDYSGGDAQLGEDIAMHIAASKPLCVSSEQVSAEQLETERRVFSGQAVQSGKPAEIVTKMVKGRITKYLAEITLLGQPFVKNPDQTVEKYLASKGARVHRFCCYQVGEGIEKKSVDFAAEVAAAAKV